MFHDDHGYERLDKSTRNLFNEIILKYKTIFILGNHTKI